jgi:hypothetical protein
MAVIFSSVRVTAFCSTLHPPVIQIVLVVSEKKVLWIDAPRVITGMADEKMWG